MPQQTQSASPHRISYPTLGEHLRDLRLRGTSFQDMARRLTPPVREETVIGWSNGSPPNARFLQAIEQGLGYRFAERAFAEAAAAASFPPDTAPEVIRALETFDDVRRYVMRAATVASKASLAGFFGWKETTFGGFVDGRVRKIPERTLFVRMLERLPELPEHLSGEALSRVTPRVVLGRLIRAFRLRRGESQREYAKRLPISDVLLSTLEGLGTGRTAQPTGSAARSNVGYFQNEEVHDQLLSALRAEREALGGVEIDTDDIPCTALAIDGSPRLTTLPPEPPHVVVRPPMSSGERPEGLGARVERCERAIRTYHGVLSAVRRCLEAAELRDPCVLADDGTVTFEPPFSAGQFREHDDGISDEEIVAVQARLEQACRDLARLAGQRDTERRRATQRRLSHAVDELYLSLEGFLRKYPSGALEIIDQQRVFMAQVRERLAGQHQHHGGPSHDGDDE